MSSSFRVGIVGCGNIADNHYRAYADLGDVKVVGVCDVDLTRAGDFAAARGIAHAVGSVDDLVALGVDAVSVCTPHPTHESVVVEVAAAGVHVLCEKPIAVASEAAQRMIDAAAAGGATLGVVFQRRFWPGAKRLRSAIDDGTFGTPMLAHCQVLLHRGRDYYDSAPWRGTWAADGGGVLMTQAIHNLDLLQWFMGKPVEVYARAGAFRLSDVIEVEDTAAAVVTFANGAVATLSATVTASPGVGTRITVTSASGATATVTEYPEGADAVADLWTVPGQERVSSVLTGGLQPDKSVAEVNESLLPLHFEQVADFVEAVRSGREPAVTGRDAVTSLRIVEAVYESARTGVPVHIGRVDDRPVFPHLPTLVPAGA